VRGLTEAMNIEWARHGITVMDVWPIFVNDDHRDRAAREP
jgi:NAD(P)-dependent dehydrogenase (short-subunit alcohol dehydrogenase family)